MHTLPVIYHLVPGAEPTEVIEGDLVGLPIDPVPPAGSPR